MCSYGLFQSTLPRRERQMAWDKKIITAEVSIHAPTKGATLKSPHKCVHTGCFNPRSHEGSDTPGYGKLRKSMSFNPRSHEGSDQIRIIQIDQKERFQSTLPRRERRYNICFFTFIFIQFQSTLPRRERPKHLLM